MGEVREATDGRGRSLTALPRRNIKLNKRSIFCSLFLTGVELRYFATLCSPSSALLFVRRSPFLLFITPFPCYFPRAIPPSFFPTPVPSSLFSLPSCFSFISSCSVSLPLFLSLRQPVRRNEPRRGEALYQSRVRSAWFIFYFGRGPNCKINTSS